MAKVKVSAIRALHAHLGDMLAQFDAGQVAATGGASGDNEETDQPTAMDGHPIIESAEENRIRNHYANMRNLVPGGDRLHNPKPRKGDL